MLGELQNDCGQKSYLMIQSYKSVKNVHQSDSPRSMDRRKEIL